MKTGSEYRKRLFRARRQILSGFLTLMLVISSLPAAHMSVSAANETVSDDAATIRLVKTEGETTVSDSAGKELAVTDRMRLYSGNHVETEEKSYAYMSLDDEKAVKLDAVSEAEVRKKGKKLEVLLDSGNLLFDVKEKLKDDETLNIRTSTMVMGIRGTAGIVSVVDADTTRVTLLDGAVECVVYNPVTGESKSIVLTAGQTADFVVYDEDVAISLVTCDIIMGTTVYEDVPGFVLVEAARDEELKDRIEAGTDFDLSGLDETAAARRLESDEAATNERVSDVRERKANQERNIAKDPVWKVTPGIRTTTTTPIKAPISTPARPQGGTGAGTGGAPEAGNGSTNNASAGSGASSSDTGSSSDNGSSGTGATDSSDGGTGRSSGGGKSSGKGKSSGNGGSTASDSGSTASTAGSTASDAGSTASTAGSTASDAGSTASTAGSTASDAGSTASTAGSTASDAGSTASSEASTASTGASTEETVYYTITWKNYDGTTIDTTQVEAGKTPTHADPTRAADNDGVYTFTGWNDGSRTYSTRETLPAVTADATYTATFAIKYNITVASEAYRKLDVDKEGAASGDTITVTVSNSSTKKIFYTYTMSVDGVSETKIVPVKVENKTAIFTMPEADVVIGTEDTRTSYDLYVTVPTITTIIKSSIPKEPSTEQTTPIGASKVVVDNEELNYSNYNDNYGGEEQTRTYTYAIKDGDTFTVQINNLRVGYKHDGYQVVTGNAGTNIAVADQTYQAQMKESVRINVIISEKEKHTVTITQIPITNDNGGTVSGSIYVYDNSSSDSYPSLAEGVYDENNKPQLAEGLSLQFYVNNIESGYGVKSVTAVSQGKEIESSYHYEYNYSFIMPDADLNITIEYGKKYSITTKYSLYGSSQNDEFYSVDISPGTSPAAGSIVTLRPSSDSEAHYWAKSTPVVTYTKDNDTVSVTVNETVETAFDFETGEEYQQTIYTFEMPEGDVTISVDLTEYYLLSILDEIYGGTMEVNAKHCMWYEESLYVRSGDEVTVTLTPTETGLVAGNEDVVVGYFDEDDADKNISVTPGDVTSEGIRTYTFEMPESMVYINGRFSAEPELTTLHLPCTATASELNGALNTRGVKEVIWDASEDSGEYYTTIYGNLSIPAEVTLVVSSGLTVDASGSNIENNGKIEIENNGRLLITSSYGKLENNGTIKNSGVLGAVDEAITGNGTLSGNAVITRVGSCGASSYQYIDGNSVYDKDPVYWYMNDNPTEFHIFGNGIVAGGENFWSTNATAVVVEEGVTGIGSKAFYNNTVIESVTLPETLTMIDKYAFYGNTSLASITIPAGVTSIGSGAFQECKKLETVTFADGRQITTIQSKTFYECYALKNISIPESVTKIAEDAFHFCKGLTSIVIPAGVTSIEKSAFYECTSLEEIEFKGSGVTSIGNQPFGYTTALKEIYFNGTIEQWKTIRGSVLAISGTVRGLVIAYCTDGAFNAATGEALTSDGNVTNLDEIESGANNTVTLTQNSTVSSGKELSIPSGKTLIIASGVELTINSGASLTIDGTIINNGTITNSGTLTNNGLLANYLTINNSGSMTNNGRLWNYSMNTINNYGNLLNNGTFHNGDGGDHDGALRNHEGGVIENEGTIINHEGSLVVNDGEIEGNEIIGDGEIDDRTAEGDEKNLESERTSDTGDGVTDGDETGDQSADDESEIITEDGSDDKSADDGTVTVSEDMTLETDLTIATGQVFIINSGVTITIPSGVKLTVESGAVLKNYGTLEVKNGATLVINGTFDNYSSHTVNNYGTILIGSGATLHNGDGADHIGTLRNHEGGVIENSGELINHAGSLVVNVGELKGNGIIGEGEVDDRGQSAATDQAEQEPEQPAVDDNETITEDNPDDRPAETDPEAAEQESAQPVDAGDENTADDSPENQTSDTDSASSEQQHDGSEPGENENTAEAASDDHSSYDTTDSSEQAPEENPEESTDDTMAAVIEATEETETDTGTSDEETDKTGQQPPEPEEQ